MAETGSPVSERFPPCGHFGSIGTVADHDDDDDLEAPIFHLSKSLTDVATDPRRGEDMARHGPDLRKSASSAVCPQADPEPVHALECGDCGVTGTLSSRGTPVAVNHLRPCEGGNLAPRGHLPLMASSSRDLRGERPDQALQRSHSVCLHAAREAQSRGLGCGSEAGFSSSGTGCCFRRIPGSHMLGFQQATALLHSNSAHTCRGGGHWSPTVSHRAAWVCTPSPTSSPAASQGHDCRAACVSHLANHAGLEDEFPAHCHPVLTPTAGGYRGQRSLLSFPRLVSSASETRLDSRHHMVSPCCGGPSHCPPPRHCPTEGRVSKEAATMTSATELRDVGIQTGPTDSPPPHVFPKISLTGEETGAGEAGEGSGESSGVGQTSPVKEVMWDAEGMTWEVYGAAVDPQELGVAIQRHLELQIKEAATGRAAKPSQRDMGTSRQDGSRKKKGGVLASLKRPTCCARPSTMGD